MEYDVIWSEFSELQIDGFSCFYKQKSKSHSVANNIIKKILLAPEKLKSNPKMGQIEFLLENNNIEYRYITVSNYKIIYSIDDKNKYIKIADVFDTRQNPLKIERKK